jgi:hypothetical protein
MAKVKFVFLAIFVAALAAATTWKVLDRSVAATPGEALAATATSPGAGSEFRGITLQLHSPQEADAYKKLVDEIAANNVNTIALVVAGYQENCASTSIFIDLRRAPGDEQLKTIIRYAHEKRLQVSLMPIVLLENPREGEWRGKISPDGGRWDDWWESYTNYVLHYANIAHDTGAEVFMVGSELISTEQQTDRWRGLIKKVRQTCTGRLCYSANWDHYKVPQFWDDLDLIGMTTYYELAGGKTPTEEVLAASWNKIKREIVDWQGKLKKRRPLLFTEVGWPNQKTAAQYPWDYYRAQDKPDPELQALCFKTFFQAWADESAVGGFLVWEWRTSLTQTTTPTEDTTYVPKDKPAMKVINDFFANGVAPAKGPTTAPSTTSGPAPRTKAKKAKKLPQPVPVDEGE